MPAPQNGGFRNVCDVIFHQKSLVPEPEPLQRYPDKHRRWRPSSPYCAALGSRKPPQNASHVPKVSFWCKPVAGQFSPIPGLPPSTRQTSTLTGPDMKGACSSVRLYFEQSQNLLRTPPISLNLFPLFSKDAPDDGLSIVETRIRFGSVCSERGNSREQAAHSCRNA